jgi:hypothetical protein
VQVVNFLICGTLMLCFAIGLHRSRRSGRAAIAAPILLGAFGLALITAGSFVTDPALGYPVGRQARWFRLPVTPVRTTGSVPALTLDLTLRRPD